MIWPLLELYRPSLSGTASMSLAHRDVFSSLAHLENASMSHLGISEHADPSTAMLFTLCLAGFASFFSFYLRETVSETGFRETFLGSPPRWASPAPALYSLELITLESSQCLPSSTYCKFTEHVSHIYDYILCLPRCSAHSRGSVDICWENAD